MPDYKAMYFELFRASVQAVQLLQDAQTRAEQQLLAADLPPLRLDETEKSDENHGLSLSEGRNNFRSFGACDKRFKDKVRKPLAEEIPT